MASAAAVLNQSSRPSSKADYQPALDGIRALAIVAVLLFHGGFHWMPGGFLGVDVFFVLSGYLITGLLIAERASKSTIDVFGFYLRRIRRLLPALVVMLVTTLTCAALFMKDVALSTARDFPWALLGLSNWWFIFHQQSYFEAMGRPALLQHTWSLAVEFQFYWIWPVLLLFVLPLIGEVGVCGLALTCGALSASALYFVTSSSHAYFGTDTHSLGLFVGAALAASRFSLTNRFQPGRRAPHFLVGLSGILAIAGLIALFHSVGESTDLRYRLGLFLTDIGSAVLIVASTFSNGLIQRILALKPLSWIGERSYSIYVWHWPIFQATRPGLDVNWQGVPGFVFRLAVTLVIAELSYRYVEMPVRQGALAKALRACRGWSSAKFRLVSALAGGCLLVLIFAETQLVQGAIRASANSLKTFGVVADIPKPAIPDTPDARIKPDTATNGDDLALTLPTILLGDSVLLGVSPSIKAQVNVVKVDAVIGRQAKELRALIDGMTQTDQLQPVVILNIGNNGTVEEPTLRAILEDLKNCRRVVVVNAHVPRRWQDDNDALLARIVPTYPNAVLADWRATSDGHPEYFWPDGIHANVHGMRAYTDTVLAALRSPKPPSH